MIEINDMSLRYADGTEALKNIELNINSGDIVYITGPSGSGKTSLLKLLIGIEKPTNGMLKVNGISMAEATTKDIRSLRTIIGPVFQEFRLIKGRTAMENVMLGMRFLNFSTKAMKESAYDTLTKVGLNHKAFSLVENLSWGEAQRVAIARAVVRKPSLILADEPTGNLDKDNAISILELLASFKTEETTVIITTHATHLIEDFDYCRHIQMENGNLLEKGWVESI